jgi:hypothetical protein
MKNLTKALIVTGMLTALSCTESYIDDIVAVAPGPDTAAPQIVVNFPLEGTLIRVVEDVTPITINFEVTDDIEIDEITVSLNGNNLATFREFLDFRRFVRTFNYPNLGNGTHRLIVSAKDKAGKTSTQTVNFEKVEPYRPIYDGEIFYLPFDGDFTELVSITNANVVGNPGFADGISGRAFAGASNAYLTFPTAGLLNQEFSASFWYRVNASPDRAGILVIGPPDPNNPATPNNRSRGFRFFREAAGPNQRLILNVGNGNADNWFVGGPSSDLNPSLSEWVHMAFSISNNQVTVYVNGEIASQGGFPGIDWTGCDVISIGSGAPRFMEWGHLSDRSLFDELRLFNKALSQQEVRTILSNERP